MAHRTPIEWLEQQQVIANQMANAAEPRDYFESGNGGVWFLLIADGLRALQAVCLAAHCPVVLTGSSSIKA